MRDNRRAAFTGAPLSADRPQSGTIPGMAPTFPDRIPTGPGVYRFTDSSGRPLYVGKAKNLRNRLAAYTRTSPDPRINTMLNLAHQVSFVACASEAEALLLEREWVHREQPPFNVRLRHGNGYPGLALLHDTTPRAAVWRGVRPKKADTFGPYPHLSGRELLAIVETGFGVRTCNERTFRQAEQSGRACLLGETGRCLAPCLGPGERDAHTHAVNSLRSFLTGKDSGAIETVREQMRAYASAENFEAAAAARDRIAALERLQQRQTILTDSRLNATAVSLRRTGRDIVLSVAVAVNGTVVSVENFRSVNDPELGDTDAWEAALADLERISGTTGPYLSGQETSQTIQARGDDQRLLVSFTDRQAELYAREVSQSPWHNALERMDAVNELTGLLELPGPARRIEAIDVSHLGGANAYARLVCLVDGFADRSGYRALPVPDAKGDDHAAISDILRARFSGSQLGLDQMPDLLLIDGGQPQVSTAMAVLGELGVRVPTAGLAKRMEEVWTAGSDVPLIVSRSSAALRLLMQARDDAHNAAITTHRTSRTKATAETLIDSAAGIGPARRAALLRKFGTWDAVGHASEADLQSVIGTKSGSTLHRHLHP